MMKLNEKYTNIKSNIQGKLNNIIAYCRENPVQVIEGFGILIRVFDTYLQGQL